MQFPRLWYRKSTFLLLLLLLLYCYVIFNFFHIISLKSSETLPLSIVKSSADSIAVTRIPEEFRTNTKTNETDQNKEDENANDIPHPVSDGQKLQKIDWNDYELMAKDEARAGPGEQGQPFVEYHTTDEKQEHDRLLKEYNFNAFASDHISLNRSIGDLRTDGCKKQHFLKDLPPDSVSIITIFHNERNSTLLRTIHAIINRTPATLLREYILVDDLSTDETLKAPLDDYITRHFPKVRIIRNQERMGLIKSRMIGADASSGKFLLFLDAHVEVNYNYLPPLLELMVLDYRTVACPMVDFISRDTLKVHGVPRVRGGFDWDFTYKRMPVEVEMDEVTPHPSPAMMGCAFAITRLWWDELGQYDNGLEIWGAEQYELSFKSWQCGGSVMDAPCSRIAHLFRPLPYVKEVVQDNLIEKNYMRVASVWMDEYKNYILERRHQIRKVNPGNLTKQLEIRERLNCKPFKWFMDEVAPDLTKYYPLVLPPSTGFGKIRSRYDASKCVTVKDDKSYELGDCKTAPTFDHDWRHHIRQRWTNCFANGHGESVFPWQCIDIESAPKQQFVWNLNNGHIVSVFTKLCLDISSTSSKLHMQACNSSRQEQAWEFETYNATLVMERWEKHRLEVET